MKEFENHLPSIKAIRENIIIHEEFKFCIEGVSNISKKILNFNSNIIKSQIVYLIIK